MPCWDLFTVWTWVWWMYLVYWVANSGKITPLFATGWTLPLDSANLFVSLCTSDFPTTC